MVSKILVAVDGSECARRAFDSALKLGKDLGAKVIVMTVVQPPSMITMQKDLQGTIEMLLEKEAKILLANYGTIAEKRGVDFETILAIGYPSRVILNTAESKGADLIVVGSRGLGGLKELFLGSVSHAVVQNADIPVLVVK